MRQYFVEYNESVNTYNKQENLKFGYSLNQLELKQENANKLINMFVLEKETEIISDGLPVPQHLRTKGAPAPHVRRPTQVCCLSCSMHKNNYNEK